MDEGRPSPLRKIVPLFVWPVGLLLFVGYCFMGRSTSEREIVRCSPGETCRQATAVALDRVQPIDLRLPIAIVAGVVLLGWGLARRVRGDSDGDK